MPQSLARVLTHLIFSTKDRQPFITPDVRDELCPYLATVLSDHGNVPIQVNAVEDHVHLLFALTRVESIAQTVAKLKTSSNSMIKPKWRQLSNFEWQSGYGIYSVGARDLDAVAAYVRNQQEHHRTIDYKDEYRKLMRENLIDIDERYVWD